MATFRERAYKALSPFTEGYFRKVNKLLRREIGARQDFQLLDVGGRKSQYTIGLRCDVQIVDLPQESELQRDLGLALTPEMVKELYAHRSNIRNVRLEDFTQTTLPDATYDGAVSVEVIEHVPDDHAFVRQLHRVLKPGGFAVLTTPNGETVENTNPDHLRHYTRQEFRDLLSEQFQDPDVFYGQRAGFLFHHSQPLWTSRKPRDLLTAPWRLACLFLNNLREPKRSDSPEGYALLFAVLRKPE